VAEGTPLLREHVGKTRIEGSNPSDSAKTKKRTTGSVFFGFSIRICGFNGHQFTETLQSYQVIPVLLAVKRAANMFDDLCDFVP
jgi:hypothetical protein